MKPSFSNIRQTLSQNEKKCKGGLGDEGCFENTCYHPAVGYYIVVTNVCEAGNMVLSNESCEQDGAYPGAFAVSWFCESGEEFW